MTDTYVHKLLGNICNSSLLFSYNFLPLLCDTCPYIYGNPFSLSGLHELFRVRGRTVTYYYYLLSLLLIFHCLRFIKKRPKIFSFILHNYN